MPESLSEAAFPWKLQRGASERVVSHSQDMSSRSCRDVLQIGSLRWRVGSCAHRLGHGVFEYFFLGTKMVGING